MHDKTMLIAGSEEKKISQKIIKLFDPAFLGLESDYKNAVMPKRKPRGKDLTNKQIRINKKISSVRVIIEKVLKMLIKLEK